MASTADSLSERRIHGAFLHPVDRVRDVRNIKNLWLSFFMIDQWPVGKLSNFLLAPIRELVVTNLVSALEVLKKLVLLTPVCESRLKL